MSRVSITPLVEGNATLRSLRDDDLALTLAWRNHDESRRWFLTTDIIEPQHHRAWFDRYLDRDDDHVFIVEIDETPRAQVALSDMRDGRAEFGRMLVDPDSRSQGIAQRATALCMRAARELFAVHQLDLEVRVDNAPAIRAYEKAGFVRHSLSDEGIVQMSATLRSLEA